MSVPTRILAILAAALAVSGIACKRKQAHHDPSAVIALAPAATAAEAVISSPHEPQPLEALSEAQAQAVLPREMAAVSLGLPAMYKKVNELARAQGLEGWPEAAWPFEDDPDPANRTNPFKDLHPAIRLIWGNVNVLWIRIPERQRWDALILMRVAGLRDESPWRLMLVKDAFGHPSLVPALPKDTWGGGNTLDWSPQTSLTYARNLDDIRKAWDYSIHPALMAFTCNQPDTDTGLSLQHDPDQGVGMQISGVAEEDPSEDMNWYLSPKQFNEAKILSMGKDFVWADIDGTKGAAARADWDQWAMQFKPAARP
ncbi:MAG TPA: hypothetical protein VL181_01225 [Holophagaceae bacterium]|nr:hypothetical protein [Holophagaceae bacterium]